MFVLLKCSNIEENARHRASVDAKYWLIYFIRSIS